MICARDDGCGMSPDDLALARYATFEIDGSDLLNIQSFVFWGDALPSLGAVGKLMMTSRAACFDAFEISACGGEISPIKTVALASGTRVELRNLFFTALARLKFMRTERTETQSICDVVKRLAMTCPYVRFELNDVSGDKSRILLQVAAETDALLDALPDRLARTLGQEFSQNSVRVIAQRDGFDLSGYAALPTFLCGAGLMQYLFVNERSVRYKLLIGVLRAAYSDFLSRDRHLTAVLFINCDPKLVDVDPAKSELRFRDLGILSGLIITALRHSLVGAGHRASATVADGVLGAAVRTNATCFCAC